VEPEFSSVTKKTFHWALAWGCWIQFSSPEHYCSA
jgi:hypothetical protein